MTPQIHLLVHNILAIASAVAALGTAYFIYINNPSKTVNKTFAMVVLGSAIYLISHVVGVNISDPVLSQRFLMGNLTILFLAAFNLHAIFAFLGTDKEHKEIIAMVYTGALFLTFIFILFPSLFLLPSVPKLYFPNYYNPGILNWIRVVFVFGLILPLALYQLYLAIKNSKSVMQRKRDIYFFVSILAGYLISFIPNFLVYGWNVDPLWGVTFVIAFTVPFAYGAVKYELLDIQVIAKQAFWYSVAVGIMGAIITAINYLSTYFTNAYPDFPIWLTPLLSALLVVTVTFLVWHKLRESDLLKYEFITTVTHKFRTPLTHIKWAAENLRQSNLGENEQVQIEYIEHSNSKLVELTGLLMNVSEVENSAYDYHLEHNDLSQIVNETIKSLEIFFKTRKVKLETDIQTPSDVLCDPSKIRFVVQTFLENAVNYSPKNPVVKARVFVSEGMVTFAVTDNGIGVPKEESALLFAKFYRSKRARLTDTEGMGIGLYICKEIIARHQGTIGLESEGTNMGSTYSFTIPALSAEQAAILDSKKSSDTKPNILVNAKVM